VISAEQQQTIDIFNAEKIEIRKALQESASSIDKDTRTIRQLGVSLSISPRTPY